jgi:hypothetical protein
MPRGGLVRRTELEEASHAGTELIGAMTSKDVRRDNQDENRFPIQIVALQGRFSPCRIRRGGTVERSPIDGAEIARLRETKVSDMPAVIASQESLRACVRFPRRAGANSCGLNQPRMTAICRT